MPAVDCTVTAWLPEVATLPLQPPEAVQEVVLLVDQASVVCPPAGTEVGLAEIVPVGAGSGVTLTVALLLALVPFVPLQVNW